MSDDLQGTTGPEDAQAPPPAPPQAPPPAQAPAPTAAPPAAAAPPAGTAPGAGPANDTSKLLAAAGYIIWIIALVAILIEPYKDEAFVKYHAVQALGLAVAGVVLSIGGSIVGVIPVIGWIVALVAGLAGIAIFILAIIAAIKAFSGEYYEVPVVYGMVKQYM